MQINQDSVSRIHDTNHRESLIDEERPNLTLLKQNHLNNKTLNSANEAKQENTQSNLRSYDNLAFIDDEGGVDKKNSSGENAYGTFILNEVSTSSIENESQTKNNKNSKTRRQSIRLAIVEAVQRVTGGNRCTELN